MDVKLTVKVKKNNTLDRTEDEPYMLSDGAVVATLLAVVAVLIIAIGIGTWQCHRKKRSVAIRRSTFQHLQTDSDQSGTSTMSSRQHFNRLLDVYQSSGSLAKHVPRVKAHQPQQSRVGAHGGPRARPVILEKSGRQTLEMDPAKRQVVPAQPDIKGKDIRTYRFSPTNSTMSTPERFRQGSDSTPGNLSHYPVGNVCSTFLDLSSPCQTSCDRSSSFGEYRINDSHAMHQVRLFKSPCRIGRQKRHMAWSLSSPESETAVISPLRSPGVEEPTMSLEPTVFYFGWPEEEEEKEEACGSGWTPLLFKTSMHIKSFKVVLDVGDEKLLLARQARSCLQELRERPGSWDHTPSTYAGGSSPCRVLSYSSTPGCAKGVVASKTDILPYGIKSTWV